MHAFGFTAAVVVSATALILDQVSGAAAQSARPAKLPPEVPANYRRLIVEDMKSAVTTQTHIRDAQIAEPEVTWGGFINPLGKAATICVTYTATNVFGGTVSAARLFYFAEGRFVRSGAVSDRMSYWRWCQSRPYTRFQEFDGVR